MHKRFNIRVYGIWVQDGMVLINEELIRGKHIVKFPGGGLEWGEGIIDCLKREWKEELDMDVEVQKHFYTTDFFQPSAYDDSQVISIYYLVSANPNAPIKNNIAGERTFWMNITDMNDTTFSLPIDQLVGKMLRAVTGEKIGL